VPPSLTEDGDSMFLRISEDHKLNFHRSRNLESHIRLNVFDVVNKTLDTKRIGSHFERIQESKIA
jgi:hypothetical protein